MPKMPTTGLSEVYPSDDFVHEPSAPLKYAEIEPLEIPRLPVPKINFELTYKFGRNFNIRRGFLLPTTEPFTGCNRFFQFTTVRTLFEFYPEQKLFGIDLADKIGFGLYLRNYLPRSVKEQCYKPKALNEISKFWKVKFQWVDPTSDECYGNTVTWDGSYACLENLKRTGDGFISTFVETPFGVRVHDIDMAHYLLSAGIYYLENDETFVRQALGDEAADESLKLYGHSSIATMGFDGSKWWAISHRAVVPVPIGTVLKRDEFDLPLLTEHDLDCVQASVRKLTLPEGYKVLNTTDSKRVAYLVAESIG